MRSKILLLSLLVSGCAGLNDGATIGNIQKNHEPLTDVPLPRVMHEDVRREYR